MTRTCPACQRETHTSTAEPCQHCGHIDVSEDITAYEILRSDRDE